MKYSTLHLCLLTLGLALALPALNTHSQLAIPADPLAAMQSLQTTNDDLLKRQEATLKELTEMTATANQVRLFSARG